MVSPAGLGRAPNRALSNGLHRVLRLRRHAGNPITERRRDIDTRSAGWAPGRRRMRRPHSLHLPAANIAVLDYWRGHGLSGNLVNNVADFAVDCQYRGMHADSVPERLRRPYPEPLHAGGRPVRAVALGIGPASTRRVAANYGVLQRRWPPREHTSTGGWVGASRRPRTCTTSLAFGGSVRTTFRSSTLRRPEHEPPDDARAGQRAAPPSLARELRNFQEIGPLAPGRNRARCRGCTASTCGEPPVRSMAPWERPPHLRRLQAAVRPTSQNRRGRGGGSQEGRRWIAALRTSRGERRPRRGRASDHGCPAGRHDPSSFPAGDAARARPLRQITTRLFENLNTRLYRSSGAHKFVGLLYGEVCEEGTFRFVSAGQPLPRVFSHGLDRFIDVEAGRRVSAPPLGIQPSLNVIDRHATESPFGFKKEYEVQPGPRSSRRSGPSVRHCRFPVRQRSVEPTPVCYSDGDRAIRL